ncbi:tetratricopeptide repeat protein [Streptomyces sp. NPDC089424]|uniref:tetratricopeptide repeat protein n=1 Tax=Streptomyces sp. NPDC089424 TaxID=3365917 RepID=UPI0037FBFA39
MLDTPEAVVEALRDNHDRPHGLPRTVTAEELVEAAEPFDKPDVLVTALLELMSAYEFTGEHRKSPVVFARLLKLWDTAPECFSEWEARQVFWRFKWVTTSLLQVPDVPLETIHGWIDRMRDRYEAADHDMQPVAAMRYHVAAHTGDGVSDAYDLWVTRPRTDLSDCEACEIRHLAEHAVRAGDDAAALETWRPVLAGSAGCTEEPQMSQARALLPLLRAGQADEARSHHLTGYRRVRGNTGMQHEVGLHVEFCALSRNEGRGLEILAENRPLFESTGAPLDHLGFLTGVEVLLARLVEDGHTATPVAGPPGRTWTAGELLTHVRSEADRLTAAFDNRGGTTATGDRRRLRLARRPLLDEPLPLGLRTSTARTLAPSTASPAAVPTATTTTTTTDVPEDFASLVREARRKSSAGHPGGVRLWNRVAERVADGTATHEDGLGPLELLHAELAEHRARILSHEDRDAESVAELEKAAELFERLGMPWQALSARTHALARSTLPESDGDEAAAGTGRPDPDAVRAGVDKALGEAERLRTEAPFTGGPRGEGEAAYGADAAGERAQEYLATLHSCTYAAYGEVLRLLPQVPDSTLEWFEECTRTLHSEAERLALPHQVANARQFVADVALRRGDLERAETELRAALEDIAASGRPWRAMRPRALLAQLFLGKDEPEAAAELLHQVIGDAVRHDDVEFPLAATYALLGHAASHTGDFGAAVRHLSEAATRHDHQGDHDAAADIRLQLADVLARSGQQADAVAVLESVLADEAAASLDERLHAQARLTLARGLRELAEYLASAEEFLRLADTVAAWEDDRATHTLVAAETAVTLAMADRWDAADTAYRRALAAHAEAPNPSLILHMVCEFARLVMSARGADGLDTALDHLKQADAVLDALDDGDESVAVWYESGSVHYRRARVLAEAERFPEALTAAEAAVAAHERGGEQGEVPRAEAVRVAALIEGNGLGRFKDATVRLTAAARRCRQADLGDAADILDALREDFLTRLER